MTVIIDTLKRGGSGTSPFPVITEEDAKIGYVIVPDEATRLLIPEWKRKAGMRVHQLAGGLDWRLGSNVTIAGQVWTEVASATGYQLLSEKNQNGGYVGLETDGFINPAYIKSIFVTDSYVVVDLAAMYALTTKTGDIIIITDDSDTYVKLNNDPPTTDAADFALLSTGASILTVNGDVGTVVIDFASMIAQTGSQIAFDAAVTANTTVAGNASQISINTGDIAAIYAILAGLGATDPSIPLYSGAATYEDGDNVVFGTEDARSLFRLKDTTGPSIGNDPDDNAFWEKIGDYYLKAEIDTIIEELPAGTVKGAVQYRNTAGDGFIATDAFYYNEAENTVYTPNIKLSGTLVNDDAETRIAVIVTATNQIAWRDVATIASPPAGNDQELQYNDSGVAGASSKLKWLGSTLVIDNGNGERYNNLGPYGFTVIDQTSHNVAQLINEQLNGGSLILREAVGDTIDVYITSEPTKQSYLKRQLGLGTDTPNANAQVDISSTTKGFLMPRMTTVQRGLMSLTAAEKGLKVYDTDILAEYSWDGTAWVILGGSSPLTTKGDIYAFGATDTALAVGTDGYVLTANSAEAKGLSWSALPGGGDMLLGTAQVVTELKTFKDGKFALQNGAEDAVATFNNSITGARVYTLPDASGTFALLSDISAIPEELADLSDVDSAVPTNQYALMANGAVYVGRALVEDDISDLGTYAPATGSTVYWKTAATSTLTADTIITGDFGLSILPESTGVKLVTYGKEGTGLLGEGAPVDVGLTLNPVAQSTLKTDEGFKISAYDNFAGIASPYIELGANIDINAQTGYFRFQGGASGTTQIDVGYTGSGGKINIVAQLDNGGKFLIGEVGQSGKLKFGLDYGTDLPSAGDIEATTLNLLVNNPVKVPVSYEDNISSDQDLINKAYADVNYLSGAAIDYWKTIGTTELLGHSTIDLDTAYNLTFFGKNGTFLVDMNNLSGFGGQSIFSVEEDEVNFNTPRFIADSQLGGVLDLGDGTYQARLYGTAGGWSQFDAGAYKVILGTPSGIAAGVLYGNGISLTTNTQLDGGFELTDAYDNQNLPEFISSDSILLNLKSTTRGLILPRQSNPDTAIVAPQEGMVAYDTTDKEIRLYTGSAWAGLGNVSKVGTPVNNQVGVWTGDGTLEGDTGFTYDAGILTVSNEVEVNGVNVFTTFGNTLTTGIVAGGEMTPNVDTTKFDISDGAGLVFDSYTDPLNPTYAIVTWTGKTAIVPTYIAENNSYIAINASGTIIQQVAAFTSEQRRDHIVLGTIVHTNGVNVTSATDTTHDVTSGYLTDDLASAIGPLNISGNNLNPASTDLSVRKEAGKSFQPNSNRSTTGKDPNFLTSATDDPLTFLYVYNDGAGDVTVVASQTEIDPEFWDDGTGTLNTVSNNNWTNQWFYFFPGSSVIVVRYGEEEFSSLVAAETAASLISPSIIGEGLTSEFIRTVITVKKGETDLTSINTVFTNTGKFGLGSGGGGSSGGIVQDLQDTYDNSVNPEILTDATRGAVSFKRGTSSDTDDVFEILNGSDTQVAAITGEGDITFSGNLLDVNRNELISFTVAGTAINQVNIANAGSGDPIIISAEGATDVTFFIESKGAGTLNLKGKTGGVVVGESAGKIGFFDSTTLVKQTTSSQTPATFAANSSGITNDSATWNGYTMGDLVAILQAYGLLT